MGSGVRKSFIEVIGIKKRVFWLTLGAILALFTFSACQADLSESANGELGEFRTDDTTVTVPPPVVRTVLAPQHQPSFRALSNAEISATGTVVVSNLNKDQMTAVANQAIYDSIPTATPIPSPQPTYTSPATPESIPWDHYWLTRPIPEGGTVWTDKAYPYGNNRGGTLRTHHGVEFNVTRGTPILAAADGTVIFAGDDRESQLGATPNFYGNVVVLQHDIGLEGQPVFSLYGHLSEILVTVGQQVFAQDTIAASGASGVADGPHLHFEVRVGENNYLATRNPLLWLYPFPDRGVVAGRVATREGQSVHGLPLNLRRIDAPSAYAATTTYADDSVNPDDRWQENFVFDDVVAGYYELSVGEGAIKSKVEFWVYPYQTNMVVVDYDG